MAIIKTNRLSMTGGGVPVIVRLSQYDADFTLIFELYSTDGTFTIPSGTTAEVRGTKSDGKGYSASATLDITNKKVTVTGDQQMTAVSGKNIFELTLWKSNKELNTANFILDVEPAALDRNTIVSESKIMELLDVTDRADEIIEAAETIESSAAQIAINTQHIAVIEEEIASIGSGLSDNAKIALLNCFAHIAWIDEHGQDYYDVLEAALYESAYPKITATFDSESSAIYVGYTLDSLKQYLTVKYYATKESAGTVIPSTDYTLYGSLTNGANTIIASYQDMVSSFSVTAVNRESGYTWLYQPSDGLLANQSFTDRMQLVENGGTETVIDGTVNRMSSPYVSTNVSNSIRCRTLPITTSGKAKLVFKACIQNTYDASLLTDSPLVIPGGFVMQLCEGGSGNSGATVYIGEYNGNIYVQGMVGSSNADQIRTETQIPISGYHIFELELLDIGYQLKIDGEIVLSSATLSSYYVSGTFFGVTGTMFSLDGSTVDIARAAYYEKE